MIKYIDKEPHRSEQNQHRQSLHDLRKHPVRMNMDM